MTVPSGDGFTYILPIKTAAPEVGWIEDHDGVTADAHVFEDPMSAVDGHEPDEAWTPHDGQHDVDGVHNVDHHAHDHDEANDA